MDGDRRSRGTWVGELKPHLIENTHSPPIRGYPFNGKTDHENKVSQGQGRSCHEPVAQG